MTALRPVAKFNPNAPGRLARLSFERTRIELRQFFRSPEQVFFTFLLPVLFVVIFSTVFSGAIDGPPGTEKVEFAQYFVPGMIATGIVSATFASLAMTVSLEQHDGLLRRLRARRCRAAPTSRARSASRWSPRSSKSSSSSVSAWLPTASTSRLTR